ncbi:DMT family transporter [Nisaea nitritireducens]|uniref:DMT family transporter n=1 Tax=Nisaea nitritireducens TaxID=568392 RepID=UPI0018672B71|nr:DMT family transporter [Nisaea nitritireducens]
MSGNLQGILWALLAAALFAGQAALVKSVVAEYHVLEILFIRQLFVFTSSLPSLARDFPGSLKTKRAGVHAARLIGAFIALSTAIWAVAVLPLTTAITLSFAKVFFVGLLAAFFLGELVDRHRIFAIIAGFCGVVVVMQPGVAGLLDLHALIPVAGAFGAAIAQVSVRKLAQTESTGTILAYQAIFVGLLSGIPMFWFWKTPDLADGLVFTAIGLVAVAGQWLAVKALRLGEASVVGNIEYTKLLYAAGFGYILFSEIPDPYTLAGAAIIFSSSAYLMYREARLKPVSPRAS